MKWHSRLLRSLRDASSAALDDSDEAVDRMFDSASEKTAGGDLHSMIQTEKKVIEDKKPPGMEEGGLSWGQRRIQWLQPGIGVEVKKRQDRGKLVHLDNYHQDMYLEIYKNLVVKGRSLRRGLNMEDGFKVIHRGWEADGMYDRIAKGGAP